MGTWSVLDRVSWWRGERELALARQRVRPLPAETVWFKRYVGESIAVPWWQVLAFAGVFGSLVAANAFFSPVQLPWRVEKLDAALFSGWLWQMSLGVMLVWMGWRSWPSLRAKARARRARVRPFVDVMRGGGDIALAQRVLTERRSGLHLESHAPFWVVLHAVAPMIQFAMGCLLIAVAIEQLLTTTTWVGPIAMAVLMVVAMGGAWWQLGNPKRVMDGRCADCGYDLRSVESEAALVAAGVDAGPGRCPECGTRLPLVPPASGREVLWWDARTRGLV
jgi:hypothetical protein